MKKTFLLFTFLINCACIQAQEVFGNADVVSSYIWRGMKLGNISLQPTVGFNWEGLTISAWGSTEFSKNNNEIDLTLEYEYKNLTLYVIDYFAQSEDMRFNYFNYSTHSTDHIFEAGIAYEVCEKFPLTLSWYTNFAGNDYRENGKRAWSSYGEISYPFNIKTVEMSAEVGFSPWEGMYADQFSVVNIGLSAMKEFKLGSKFSLGVSGKLVANPYEEKVHVVVGIQVPLF